MVRFRDGKPTGIYYSQHSSGAAYQWNDTRLSLEDERVSFPSQATRESYCQVSNTRAH